MRKKKNLIPRTEACADILAKEPQAFKGTWRQRLGMAEGSALELEIGCGKGGFITTLAPQNPQSAFVAVEKVDSVLLLALETAKALDVKNTTFISTDAALLGDVFAENEVDRIYLNFSDPWPQKKHHKRRLTHKNMLEVYDGFLRRGGEICFKTDNRDLFEFSLVEFSQFGYTLSDVTRDLHRTETPNIMTEYELAFSEKGINICRCVARKE